MVNTSQSHVIQLTSCICVRCQVFVVLTDIVQRVVEPLIHCVFIDRLQLLE